MAYSFGFGQALFFGFYYSMCWCLREGNFFTSLPSTKVAPSLSHSPLPVLPVFKLHGSWRHFGAVLPDCGIKKKLLTTRGWKLSKIYSRDTSTLCFSPLKKMVSSFYQFFKSVTMDEITNWVIFLTELHSFYDRFCIDLRFDAATWIFKWGTNYYQLPLLKRPTAILHNCNSGTMTANSSTLIMIISFLYCILIWLFKNKIGKNLLDALWICKTLWGWGWV